MAQRRGGIIQVKVNGEIHNVKGSWSYNLGRPKREPILGSDGLHGYKETPQVAFIEGEITDRAGLDLASFLELRNATVSMELANGKYIVLRDAYQAGDGTGSTDEGNIPVRFEGASADEVD